MWPATGLMVAGEVQKLAQGTPVDFRALANWVITGVLLASLWGYALRRRIGYVIQEVGLFPHFTVGDNVGLVPKLEGWTAPDIENRVNLLFVK